MRRRFLFLLMSGVQAIMGLGSSNNNSKMSNINLNLKIKNR